MKRWFVGIGLLGGVLLAGVWAELIAKGGVAEFEESASQITYFGGAGEVAGSMALLEHAGLKVVIDVGSAYAREGDVGDPVEGPSARAQEGGLDEANFGFDVGSVDAVLLTHAHLDHTGRLPELIRAGFEGQIYGTAATRELLGLMLPMQVRHDETYVREWSWSGAYDQYGGDYFVAHWMESCQWNRKIARGNRRKFKGTLPELEAHVEKGVGVSPCKVCAQVELEGVWKRFVVKGYEDWFTLKHEVRVKLLDARHIPGSASLLISLLDEDGGEKRLLVSGDVGSDMSRFLEEPEPAPKVDFLFVESTYGAFSRPADAEDEYGRFRRLVGERVGENGIVWIPAFALDRSQRVLWEIHEGQREGVIPADTPIVLASPSAGAITDLYIARRDWHRQGVAEGLARIWARTKRGLPFDQEKAMTEIEGLLEDGRGLILISTSGMMDQVYSANLLKPLCSRKDVSIIFVGYSDPKTPSGQLKAGANKLEFDGEEIRISAEIEEISCFSGHGDADDLDRWLSSNAHARIFLVHGDPEALEARRTDLLKKGFRSVAIPQPAVRIPLH